MCNYTSITWIFSRQRKGFVVSATAPVTVTSGRYWTILDTSRFKCTASQTSPSRRWTRCFGERSRRHREPHLPVCSYYPWYNQHAEQSRATEKDRDPEEPWNAYHHGLCFLRASREAPHQACELTSKARATHYLLALLAECLKSCWPAPPAMANASTAHGTNKYKHCTAR